MLFALRPEKTFLSMVKPQQRYNWVEGIVWDIAYLGGHSLYYVKLPSSKIVQCFLAKTQRRADRPSYEDFVSIFWSDDSGMVIHK